MSDPYKDDLEQILSIVKASMSERKQFKQSLKTYLKALDYQSTLRGRYLVVFTQLESRLENLIAEHFCADEDYQNMLISWVLKDTPFRRKISILKNILDCYDHVSVNEARRDLITDLEKINKFRNDVAHLVPHIDETKSIQSRHSFHMIKFNGAKKETREITKIDIEKRTKDVKIATARLNLLHLLIIKYGKTKLVF